MNIFAGLLFYIVTEEMELLINLSDRLLFSGNLIKHPCFDQIRGTDEYRVVGELTNTEFIMNNTFWVGVYPGMSDVMIDYMAKVIIEAVS